MSERGKSVKFFGGESQPHVIRPVAGLSPLVESLTDIAHGNSIDTYDIDDPTSLSLVQIPWPAIKYFIRHGSDRELPYSEKINRIESLSQDLAEENLNDNYTFNYRIAVQSPKNHREQEALSIFASVRAIPRTGGDRNIFNTERDRLREGLGLAKLVRSDSSRGVRLLTVHRDKIEAFSDLHGTESDQFPQLEIGELMVRRSVFIKRVQ